MLISASGQQVQAGVRLVADTGKALGRIVEQVAKLNDLITDIAASAREQSTGLGQVNKAVNQMDQVTQQNAAMVEEATAASHSLASEADALSRLVGQFNVGRKTATRATAPGGGRSAAVPSRATAAKVTGGKGGGHALPPKAAKLHTVGSRAKESGGGTGRQLERVLST